MIVRHCVVILRYHTTPLQQQQSQCIQNPMASSTGQCWCPSITVQSQPFPIPALAAPIWVILQAGAEEETNEIRTALHQRVRAHQEILRRWCHQSHQKVSLSLILVAWIMLYMWWFLFHFLLYILCESIHSIHTHILIYMYWHPSLSHDDIPINRAWIRRRAGIDSSTGRIRCLPLRPGIFMRGDPIVPSRLAKWWRRWLRKSSYPVSPRKISICPGVGSFREPRSVNRAEGMDRSSAMRQ